MDDPYNLSRFVEAQSGVFNQVLTELRQGNKRSHWMWFVFPQVAGLGYSAMSRKFAITSLDEARAYLNHSILGPRLIECTALVNSTSGKTIDDIFGSPDDMKFHSCMTLFATAASGQQLFKDALQKFFGGRYDQLTLDRLGDLGKSQTSRIRNPKESS
jgi:uncharacterized protein (DUF1810 family)